jgi:hypothetical protein
MIVGRGAQAGMAWAYQLSGGYSIGMVGKHSSGVVKWAARSLVLYGRVNKQNTEVCFACLDELYRYFV